MNPPIVLKHQLIFSIDRMDTNQELDEFIKKLRASGKLIIVEGVKDKAGLEALGIENVMTLKKPIHSVIEEATAKTGDIIILTDLDSHGKELFGKLSSALQHRGVRIDNSFREFLFRKTKLRQIEGIKTYLENHTDPHHSKSA